MSGPLLVALILTVTRRDYKIAFASLAGPAVITLSLLAVARVLYPRPQDLAAGPFYAAAMAVSGTGSPGSPPTRSTPKPRNGSGPCPSR